MPLHSCGYFKQLIFMKSFVFSCLLFAFLTPTQAQLIQESSFIFEMFGGDRAAEGREELMPFLWRSMASKGQLYGNGLYGNKMNVSNPYKISYPGYNEIITGRPTDLSVLRFMTL